MVVGVRPVLDCIDMEAAHHPDNRPPCPDTIIDRVQGGMGELQKLQLRGHYLCRDGRPGGGSVSLSYDQPSSDRGGFTRGMGATRQEQLKDEVEDAAKKLAGDIDLFGEADGDGQT